MKKLMIGLFVASLFHTQAFSMTVRASALSPELVKQFASGDVVVEFQNGDRLPVQITASGDLFETANGSPSYWSVKRDFYVKSQNKQILLSLDGITFKPIQQMLSGNLSMDASAGVDSSIANMLSINLQTLLK